MQSDIIQQYLKKGGVTSLHAAVLSNQLQQVKNEIEFLKKSNKSLDSQLESGETSLLLAASKLTLDTSIAKLLIEEGADVNICNDKKRTPLHAACSSQKADIVEILLKVGANVNAQDIDHCNTPLHYAVLCLHSKITDLLLDAGADANIKNNNTAIPLFYIFTNSPYLPNLEESTLERLVSVTTNLNLTCSKPHKNKNSYCFDNGNTLLENAILVNYISLASALIKYGADVNLFTVVPGINKGPPILQAVVQDRIEIFQMLWKETNTKKFEDPRLWYEIIRWASNPNYPDRVESFYQVMTISGVILNSESRYFHNLANNLPDDRFLEVDLIGILKLLFEKGATLHQQDLEDLIYLCYKYYRDSDFGMKLLDLFIDTNINVTSHYIYLSVVNHPEFTLNLLQYCITCDPIDIFKHVLKCKRKPDVPFLHLIRNVLKLCSPYCGLRFRRFLHLQLMRNKDSGVRTPYSLNLDPLYYPWHECIRDSNIDNELLEEVLDLLYRYRVPLPTLVELSRNKIRQQLRLSCKDTKSYLQTLKALELPRTYIDIIQCKADIIQ